MKVAVHSIQFDADQKLVHFIENKVGKLDHFHDHIIGSEVILKVDNSSDQDNKIAEIKLNVPGKELFAKKQSKSFEEATDSAVEAIRRQMKKFKEKERS